MHSVYDFTTTICHFLIVNIVTDRRVTQPYLKMERGYKIGRSTKSSADPMNLDRTMRLLMLVRYPHVSWLHTSTAFRHDDILAESSLHQPRATVLTEEVGRFALHTHLHLVPCTTVLLLPRANLAWPQV